MPYTRHTISTQIPRSALLLEAEQAIIHTNIPLAMQYCKQAVTAHPHDCDAHHALAVTHLYLDQWEQALPHLSHAISLSMQYHHYYHYEASAMHTLRGDMYEAQTAWDKAAKEFETALHLDHLNTYAKAHKAACADKKMATTIPPYTTAPELMMDIAMAIRLPGAALGVEDTMLADISSVFRDGDYNTAHKAMELLQPNADILHDMGCCYFHLAEHDRAREYFKKALAENPNHSHALYGLAKIAYARNDITTALLQLEKAIAACAVQHEHYHAQASLHHEHRAYAFYQLKRYDEAVRDYSKALDLNRKNTNAYLGRGDVYTQKENYRDAMRDYQTALILDPTSLQAQDGLKKTETMSRAM